MERCQREARRVSEAMLVKARHTVKSWTCPNFSLISNEVITTTPPKFERDLHRIASRPTAPPTDCNNGSAGVASLLPSAKSQRRHRNN